MDKKNYIPAVWGLKRVLNKGWKAINELIKMGYSFRGL